jgi:hypothetical protein
LNFLCWVCYWERWEQQWKEHINFGLFHHDFLGNMGWKGVLGNHLKAMFWQTHLYKIWYSELGTFLGTIREERQTLALLNDFLGNTSCGVFLGWSGSHWEPANYLVRDSLGLLSLRILAKYWDDMTSMNNMGR